VFLLLSAFLPKEQVVAIFHKDLFADMSLFPIYKQLLGLEGTKPFDCVGTPEESIYAFTLMAKRGEYTDDVIVKELLPRISNKVTTEAEVMNNISLTGIPDEFRSIFSI